MTHDFTTRAAKAVDRYSHFVAILRSQSDRVLRRGATDESLRNEAISTALTVARDYANTEHAWINEDTADVARAAYKQAREDLGVAPGAIEDRFGDFIFSAASYTSRIMAAQAERDVMSLAQHIHQTAQRIDLYVRSGRHTRSSATAAVMLEDQSSPAFRFVDRAGRRFKSTKHVRDTYRLHLLNTYNEVYMDVVASHGHDVVNVAHPDPNYRWVGEQLAIVSGTKDLPLYYDVRDEVFHPSSDATLTIL